MCLCVYIYKGEIKRMRKSGKMLVRVNKSKNIYQVSPCEYEQILNDKITESYRIDHSNTSALINRRRAKCTSK